jgi:hypothetical protein
MKVAIAADARKIEPDYIPIRDLIPTMPLDIQVAADAAIALSTLDSIRADVLLMGGDRSHPDLRGALDQVARRLPAAQRVLLEGAGHVAADNNGRPDEVARLLRGFFGPAAVITRAAR